MPLPLDTVHTFALTIAGTHRMALLQRGSLRWKDVEGREIDTLRFGLEDATNTLSISEWQEVIFSIDGVAAFGGYVIKAQPALVANGNHRAWAVTCESYVTLLSRTPRLRQTWTGLSCGAILAAAFTAAGLSAFNTSTYVAAGPTLTSFTAAGETVGELVERLAALAAADLGEVWPWQIRADKKVYFRAASADVAPFGLALGAAADWSTSYPVSGLPAITIDASQLINRVTVRGGTMASAELTDTFTGDGVTTLFALTTLPVRDIVRITLAGALQSHGVDWYDAFGGGFATLVNYNAGTLRFPDASPPAVGAALVVVYRSDVAVLATAESAASHTLYGLWLDKEYEDRAITAQTDAEDLAAAILERYAFGAVAGKADVERYGIRAGQQVAVNFAALGVVGDYTVRNVQMELRPDNLGLRCSVSFGGLPDSFSSAIGGNGGGSAQPPLLAGEIGLARVRERIEFLDPLTAYVEP